ncbi:MAG: HAMP domain-containing histidine kinase [Reichenbachiella sp.]
MLSVMVAIAVIFLRPDLLYTQIILLVVLVSLVVELTVFLNKTNQDLARFVTSVMNEDFTTTFKETKRTKSFDTLYSSFNQFVNAFRELQTRNAGQFHFLKQLVDQIEFGIITFGENDRIDLMNSQAQVLLELHEVADWKKIQNPNIRFLETLLELPMIKNQLIETTIGSHQRSFSVSMMSVVIEKKQYKIASFQDIRSEIQSKEIEAWHKLIRILTHEIMNSVTPMVSLTETIQMILQDENKKDKKLNELNPENISDVNEAIVTIKETSEGILKFITNYRKISKTPKPELMDTSSKYLIDGVLRLMDAKLKESKVEVIVDLTDATLKIDSSLVSQVLINLIKNAIESIKESSNPCIMISSRISAEQYQISVGDNGPGMTTEQMEKIFVPFFTTKRDGSGIGLSISRQIMSLHGGSVEVNSIPYQQTVFSLMFPVRLYQIGAVDLNI